MDFKPHYHFESCVTALFDYLYKGHSNDIILCGFTLKSATIIELGVSNYPCFLLYLCFLV